MLRQCAKQSQPFILPFYSAVEVKSLLCVPKKKKKQTNKVNLFNQQLNQQHNLQSAPLHVSVNHSMRKVRIS
jgi:hypothetical protein